ncbi:hypothetical protein INR49_010814 [Caranx melampygus]|nr:hypothetical protein INR49_010814 [Caranx melampygus]
MKPIRVSTCLGHYHIICICKPSSPIARRLHSEHEPICQSAATEERMGEWQARGPAPPDTLPWEKQHGPITGCSAYSLTHRTSNTSAALCPPTPTDLPDLPLKQRKRTGPAAPSWEDSDNSSDWLASDNEDNESEWESDCTRKHGQTEAPPSPSAPPHLGPSDGSCLRSSEVKEGDGNWSEVREASGWGSTPGCTETYDSTIGLRLSSFQESVAMDRIQRIMGVLRNPCMGEKYINIILKMEEMLKSWFPNVKLQDQVAVAQTEEAVPTKKPKLSPVTTSAAVSPVTMSDPPVGAKALRVTDLTPAGAYSANNLKWLHTSPICSPTAEQAQAGPRHLLSPRDRDLTQDNAVSSSTDTHTKTDSVPRGLPPGKINAPCLERLLKSTESIITRKETRELDSMLDQQGGTRLKGVIGRRYRGRLSRLHCFGVAAPDSISQGKANGLDSRHSSPPQDFCSSSFSACFMSMFRLLLWMLLLAPSGCRELITSCSHCISEFSSCLRASSWVCLWLYFPLILSRLASTAFMSCCSSLLVASTLRNS